jgi:UDP-N-acetylglucosamine:LPS N-acetylglucosamine transferase
LFARRIARPYVERAAAINMARPGTAHLAKLLVIEIARVIAPPVREVDAYRQNAKRFVASAAASIATGWSEPVPGRELHPL